MSEEGRVEDYAAPAAPQPTQGKVKRKLHLYLILGFAILAAPAIIWKSMSDQAQQSDARRERKEAQAKETVSAPPSLQPIKAEIEAQARSAAESRQHAASPPDGTVPTVREPVRGPRAIASGDAASSSGGVATAVGSLLPSPAAYMLPDRTKDAAELERMQRERDAQAEATRVKSSAILVLTAGGDDRGTQSAPALSPQELLRGYGSAVTEAAQRYGAPNQDAAKIAAAFGAGESAKPPSKVEEDRAWLAKQGQAKAPVTLAATRAASPYTIFQGAIIPAVLLTEVNSDLPGMLAAQVTLDIYDGIRGTTLLIPKGSRLVGSYNNDVRAGQERVMAAFNRIIYPSGASVDLGAMSAADQIGRSGMNDEVDTHFWKQFGANFLVAGLAALINPNQNNASVTIVNGGGAAVSNAAGQILVETVRSIQQRNAFIPPTIRINSGYKFNILVNKDMALPPQVTGWSPREGG